MSETHVSKNFNPCTYARSFLFVPGNRPERFAKAISSGADAVILDLEDSVPVADKTLAREAITREWPRMQGCKVPLVVRINAITSNEAETDLAWLSRLPGVAAVMIPKAESADCMARLRLRLGPVMLLPLIESAAGYQAVNEIASVPGVLRLAVGHIDFMADTGIQCDDAESELIPLRFAVTVATRLHQLSSAIDGVTVQVGDVNKLRSDTSRAVRLGFGAKLCIHPRQIDPVHAALMPSEEAVSWAQRVIAADAASGGAAVLVDGNMIDLPLVIQARSLLMRAKRFVHPIS